MKDLKVFLEELANSEALQNGLNDALQNKKLPEFLKENGCDADPAELVDFFRKIGEAGENESMSLDDMDAVAGGGNLDVARYLTDNHLIHNDEPIIVMARRIFEEKLKSGEIKLTPIDFLDSH